LIRDVHNDPDNRIDSLRQETQNGFQQVNARLIRADLVWKVARDWARDMDDHEIKADAVIGRHERKIAKFDERLARLERESKKPQ
jgi:hypothetical protein